MVVTEGITVLEDYMEVGGGWGSVWITPGNRWVNFCEGSLLLGWRVGKCGMDCVLPFCCFCRGLVEWGETHSDSLPDSVRYSKVAHIRGFFSSYLRFLCPQCIGSF